MKAREDPRITQEYNGDFYSEDDSSYDSEESSSESSPSSSREHYHNRLQKEDHVLVVAGCKSCFMYFMVPKQVEVCPKCNGQLLHFDRSENGSPWIRFLVWFFFFCFCVFFLPFWKLICVLLMEIQCGKIMKRVTNELLLVSLLLVFYQIFLSLFVFFL